MSDHTFKNAQSYDSHADEWESVMPINLGHTHLEKPAMMAILPQNLKDRSVVCIGVGSGEELEFLIEREAKDITAIDISGALLKRAVAKFPSVRFLKMDMMSLSFPDESFDIVYSSLAFHYTNDWDILLVGVYRVLKKKGLLIFSTHRPEFWDRKQKTGNIAVNARGVALVEHRDILPGNVEIFFYNQINTDAVVESVTHAGFTIRSLTTPSMVEPNRAVTFDRGHYDALNRKNTENPLFLVIGASK